MSGERVIRRRREAAPVAAMGEREVGRGSRWTTCRRPGAISPGVFSKGRQYCEACGCSFAPRPRLRQGLRSGQVEQPGVRSMIGLSANRSADVGPST